MGCERDFKFFGLFLPTFILSSHGTCQRDIILLCWQHGVVTHTSTKFTQVRLEAETFLYWYLSSRPKRFFPDSCRRDREYIFRNLDSKTTTTKTIWLPLSRGQAFPRRVRTGYSLRSAGFRKSISVRRSDCSLKRMPCK